MHGMFPRSAKRKVRAQLASAVFESLESRTLLSTYYVAPTGSDSAAGSASAPWATLQTAANNAKAGDTIVVQAGNYAGFMMEDGGAAGAPITFKAQPGATITSANGSTADGINLEGASYVTIDGFTINNANGSISRAGIRAVLDHDVLIQNNTTTKNGTWGIYTSHTTDVTIQNNTSSYNNNSSSTWNHHGIYVSNSAVNPIVRNNVVFGNIGNGIHFNGDASQGGDGVVTGALIEGNIVYDNGTGGGSAINCDGISNSIIRNNVLYNNHAKGIALYQIDAATGSQNNIIENNTVIQASGAGPAMSLLDWSTGNQVRNNIFLGGGGSWNIDDSSLPAVSDYNVADSRSTSGQDTHSIIGASTSSLFANPGGGDYHLSATSPAIDKGTATNAPSTDRDGKPRPVGAGYDIGAYEYQSGGTNTGGDPGTPVVTIPAAPTALSAAASSSNQIGLKWTDNATDETGYKVERSTAGGAFTLIGTLGAGATSLNDTTVTAGTTYAYRVYAYNSAGNSAYSNTATATTAAPPVTTISPSIWGATAPTTSTVSDGQSVELGTQFSSSVAGYITGVRFYKGDGNTGTHTGTLWSSTGQKLATVTFTNETASGWQQANFSTPVYIQPNTTYVVSYHAPAGHYADDQNYFNNGAFANGSLKAINGVYSYVNGAFPASTWLNSNYYVDVAFSTQQPTVTVPAAPSGLTAAAASSTQVNLAWTDNSTNETAYSVERATGTGAFTQIASLGAGVNSYVDSTAVAGTQYSYRVCAANSAGNSAYSNTAIVTTPSATTTPVNQSVWTPATTPALTRSGDWHGVELGTQFKSDMNGYITGVRFYKSPGDGGTHTGSLWDSTGKLLARATFANETASGWQTVSFSKPVAVTAGQTYTASFHSNGDYMARNYYFANGPYTNSHLTAKTGVYRYGTSAYPTSTWAATNYGADVVFASQPSATPAMAAVATGNTAASKKAAAKTASSTMKKPAAWSVKRFTLWLKKHRGTAKTA